ncbi:hypothetical protein B0H65DRAFT_511624 [Neurospora tetraspora]|uniref:Vacuolar calcium ion transporter n=1 Tax=Neurospora tetraspora TaxID=94610 RepID=A0AAE0J971_9PEZI|nr:hypothetical protein B0H65DRAFT_511624 [Neurospora tetraspora]
MTSPYHAAAREKRAAERDSDERNVNSGRVPRGSSSSRGPQQLPLHSVPIGTEGHGHHPNHHPPAPKSWFPVREEGESGRSGIHPWHFLRIVFRSSSLASRIVNVLWPVVPAAIALRYAAPEQDLAIFILAYIAMVPCANLVGFAGQNLAKKVPHVFGVLAETTFGSLVEIIMFIVLIKRYDPKAPVDTTQVIRAAILGSILATMLFCLGFCFIAAGFKREETHFSEIVSEAGSGLLLTAGFGLAVPTAFFNALYGRYDTDELRRKTLEISRSTAVLLIIAYLVYVFFQMRTHHGIYDAIFEADAERDDDKHKELRHHRLTLFESVIGLAVGVALITIIAIMLVDRIHFLVEKRHVSDAFLGLIMIPLVEKAAEHLTAVDEAYDNQMNIALSTVLGSTLQTALFNGPLVVIIGWGMDKPMGFNFELFDLVMLILAILTVGNFLRDQKSNYLEGVLCVIVYVAIGVAAAHYPNPHDLHEAFPMPNASPAPTTSGSEGAHH